MRVNFYSARASPFIPWHRTGPADENDNVVAKRLHDALADDSSFMVYRLAL
jgi:hypothetical protein